MTTMSNIGGHDRKWMRFVCKKHLCQGRMLGKVTSTSSATTRRMKVERGIKNEDIERGRSDLFQMTHGALFVLRRSATCDYSHI